MAAAHAARAYVGYLDVGAASSYWIAPQRQSARHILRRLDEAFQAPANSLELAIDYAANRTQFGKTLVSMQVIRHQIAEMALTIEQARQLTYHALWLHAQKIPCVKEVSMAKIAPGPLPDPCSTALKL